MAATIYKDNSENAVLQALHGFLRKGQLVGRGHKSPVVEAKEAERIHASLWNFLCLDIEKRTAKGDAMEYVGVEIGKAEE